jgi:formylglycine-generating enzyme required for sulfatase activity
MFKSKCSCVIILIFIFLLTNCDTSLEVSWAIEGNIYQIEYNMIKVPVPEGGIDFPIGIDDDDTARIEKAFYISEILVTYALYDTVCRWALEREFGYYYGLVRFRTANLDFPITKPYGRGYNATWDYHADISMYYVVPIWLNAFTEWYNEKHGTNLVPVYQDSYGNPLRGINNMDNVLETANPNATGFRLPTSDEWELAARWNGDSEINTVTKIINGIDFSNQEIKFTTGRSASGARNPVDNFDENDLVAVWKNNSGVRMSVKSKNPNMLGIYDMSGNCHELTSTWGYGRIGSTDWWTAQCRGGSASADYEDIAVGKYIVANFNRGSFEGVVETSNIGIRLARNVE